MTDHMNMCAWTRLVALLFGIFTTTCRHLATSQCTSQFCFGMDENDEMPSSHLNLKTISVFLANQDETLANAQEELVNQRRDIDQHKQQVYDLVRTVAHRRKDVMRQQSELKHIRETLYEVQQNITELQHEQLNQRFVDSNVHVDTLAAMAQMLTGFRQQLDDHRNKLAKPNQILEIFRSDITGR